MSANPTHYRVVGWFSLNPLDTSLQPFPLTVTVETNSEHYAFEAGERALHKIKHESARLLNWYVEPLQCYKCKAYITDTQAKLSELRADDVYPACKDCVTLEVTQARCDHKFVDSDHCLKCGWKP